MFDDIANEVCCALNNYHELFKPNRLVRDVDLEQFLTQYRDLFNKVNFLESHKRFEQCLFDEYKITDLQQAVKCFQEYKEKSNTIYFAISDIQQQAQDISSRFKRLMLPNHYFTFSQMRGFKESIEHHIESAKLLHSEYQQYISDNTTKEVIDMIVNIEDNRAKHNREFVDAELSKNKEYFDTVLGNYPLDPQQRDSIVKLEDNTLVIASAGSGKTSTIVGKIKYLVEKQKVDPSKILLLTYTKKAAMELSERVKVDGLLSGTFHGLAYKIIAETTGQAPSVCNADVTLNVFRKLLSENNDFLQAINSYILNYQSLMKLEHEYDDAFAYYEDRKKYGIQSLFSDIDGKLIFTKSEEEKRICTILAKWGVKFRYEQDYQFDTKTPEHRQYKPDF
jgi:DNA helicase-4